MSFSLSTASLVACSGLVSIVVFIWEYNDGKDMDLWGEKKRLYSSGILPDILLLFLLIIFLYLEFFISGWKGFFLKYFMQITFHLYLAIGVYYVVLILMLPCLHKLASAKTCAFLWLLPNLMYAFFIWFLKRYMDAILHVFVISVSYPKLFLILWFLGFVSVLSYKLFEHLIFRKRLLKEAREICDGEVYDQLALMKREMGFGETERIRLFISNEVESPLTIGIFRSRICMVLPHCSYTKEELYFIFRHELIHVSREDARCKLFFTVCLAIFWFNPLMWFGFQKCKDDLELSCDETVLIGADQKTRKDYARLVLGSTGNDRGFSSCLSAKASTLRYRLKCMVEPKKYYFGSLIAGILFFVLVFSMESFTFASAGASVDDAFELVLADSTDEIVLVHGESNISYATCDQEALLAYMKELDLCNLYCVVNEDYKKDYLIVWKQARVDGFILYDHYMLLYRNGEVSCYYLKEAVDFSALQELISKGGMYKGHKISRY